MSTPGMLPLDLHGYPRAILHVDGDAFFATVEQAMHPELKGRPLVTGKERGIIACASYEAKALGVTRGLPLHEARAKCPDLVVLPSDYETYSLYSKRMFDIMRRFTPMVEEYSIDEGFLDLTGLRRFHRKSYEDIARAVQQAICAELGISVSAGLSLSKGLAKLCSKFRKPAGFTAVEGKHVRILLQKTPLEKVWGFGHNTAELLRKQGLQTAYDYATRSEDWAGRLLGKIGREQWNELRGHAVYPVTPEEKSTYYTISKCKSFSAPSADRDFVYAKLVRNLEAAFMKLRRHRLRARVLAVALRTRGFEQGALEAELSRATASTQDALPLLRELFDQLFRPGVEYRTTLVVIGKLEPDREEQFELFEDRARIDKLRAVNLAVDEVNGQFGKYKVSPGTALLMERPATYARDEKPWRQTDLLPGETPRRRLKLPRLALTVS